MDMWICLDETDPVFIWQGQDVAKPHPRSLQDQQSAEVENQT